MCASQAKQKQPLKAPALEGTGRRLRPNGKGRIEHDMCRTGVGGQVSFFEMFAIA
jgi:hypothetical protein